MGNQDGADFLLAEYAKSVDLIEHYDNLRISLMKFAFSYHSVVAAVTLAVYRYQVCTEKDLITELMPVMFLFIVFLTGTAIILMLAQNRKYFVLAARQANTIRGVLFSRGNLALSVKSALSTNPDEPKMFHRGSAHLITIFLLVIINSTSLSFATLFLAMILHLSFEYHYLRPATSAVISLALQICVVKRVLKEAS